MRTSTNLFDTQRDAITSLAAAVEAADGISPLNEAALLALSTPDSRLNRVHASSLVRPSRLSAVDQHDEERSDDPTAAHWFSEADGSLVGYAQWHLADQTGLVFVHPDHRNRGLGRELADALAAAAGDRVAIWAFGDFPAAQRLATAAGLRAARGLHQMTRPLTDLQTPKFAAGTTVRSFTLDDLAIVHKLNAAAFAHHPEQGRLTIDDLRIRMDEAWFDPAGLILAFDGTTPLGFHWTKRECSSLGSSGEVYVLGVAPTAAGRGLGKALLWAGLRHLADVGCSHVDLFVDADNTPAVQLYVKAGFTIIRTDTLYRPRKA